MAAKCEFTVISRPSYTRRQVAEALEIGEDRLRQITGILNQLNPVGWNHRPYRRTFSSQSFEVLKTYRTLLDLHGEYAAIKDICAVCKQKFSHVEIY